MSSNFPARVVDVVAKDEPIPPDGGDDNAEFEDGPWNALCIVGLRVLFKDGACSVETVRPRQEEQTLDLDDASSKTLFRFHLCL